MGEEAAQKDERWLGRRSADADADDLRAVAETLRGDRDAFRAIVDRHGPMILRLAGSFLRNPEDAEEASQEIFLRAFRSLRSFSIERRFLPWLYAMGTNYLRTHYKVRKRRESRIVEGPAEIPDTTAGREPGTILEAASARSELRQAIESLPDTIRPVVILYYVEAMSVSQIATMLGIGDENVKSRLHRGRKQLRIFLGADATPGTPAE